MGPQFYIFIPKEGLVGPRLPILFWVWQRHICLCFSGHYVVNHYLVDPKSKLFVLQGDRRRNYPIKLSPPCTIWYVGAHTHGADGKYFNSKYGCTMHVFEPMPAYFKQLQQQKWTKGDNVILHNYGLGMKDENITGITLRCVFSHWLVMTVVKFLKCLWKGKMPQITVY